MSKKYIEADALTEKVIEVIEHIGQDKEGTPKLQEFVATCLLGLIEVVPAADVVEVVRCKDCKHTYVSDNFGITAPWLMCGRHIGGTYKTDDNNYCSWGERKDC